MLFYVQVQTWAVYVKDGNFFESQGGLRKSWGDIWIPVFALDVEGARKIGERHQKNFLPAKRIPAANKEDFSKMSETRLRYELGSCCGLHGQEFLSSCNACASAYDARMSAKEGLGKIT